MGIHTDSTLVITLMTTVPFRRTKRTIPLSGCVTEGEQVLEDMVVMEDTIDVFDFSISI
jgi:hypothetical protein